MSLGDKRGVDQDADGGWQNGRKQGSVGMRVQPDIGLLKKDPFITGLFFGQKLSVSRQTTANCHSLPNPNKTAYCTHLVVYIVFY
jgi:hypothetical protein